MDSLTTYSTRRTPQSQKADPRQKKNAAGGYTFVAGDDARLHRFLTLGTDGGTYYTSADELTADNAAVVRNFAENRPLDLVRAIVDISVGGRAPKQNPAIFALAMCAGLADDDGRKAALAALPQVCRTGTHLFLFTKYVEQFRGWGRGLRTAVGNWYLDKPTDKIAYQAVKYRQREDWTHRDLLRLSHPVADFPDRINLFNWITGKGYNPDLEVGARIPLIEAFEKVQSASVPQAVQLISDYDLSWEMLPDSLLGESSVWEALLTKGMPQTALMRQLPRLTRLGLTKGATGKVIAKQLADPELLKRGRVHPVNVLVAQRTYTAGASARGSSTWTPDRIISDALDAAFYAAYGAVEPADKRTLLALDVSGSMGTSVSGLPLTCREASAALAMVTAATEPDYQVVGFTSAQGRDWTKGSMLKELDISPRRRLDDNLKAVANLPFGRTDCALPMLWATQNKVPIDTFQIYTDNETWYGSVHPHQALTEYREKMGIDARLAVVAMTATGQTIADPSDPKQLDVSGFDSTVPNLLSDFSRGSF